jgi:RNA polymerase sigma-70 factor (ECF subfamily)
MLPVFAPTQALPNDAELAQRIGAGDEQAFELLMRRHNQLLFRTARSIVHDDAEAEDVVQDAYLLAYRGIGKYRGDAKLSTWLTRIVVNEAIARSRKTTRRAEVMRLHPDGDINNEHIEADMIEPATESAERQAMRAQARHLLEASIDALPEAFRTVFVLRAVEEMSGEEVARCLDIPEATVRSRFFRARSQLRAALLAQLDIAFEDVFSFDGARCDRIVAAVLARLPGSPTGPA